MAGATITLIGIGLWVGALSSGAAGLTAEWMYGTAITVVGLGVAIAALHSHR